MHLLRFNFLYLVFVIISLNYHYCEAKSKLIQLNEDNWDAMLKGEWMVEFFAPWCPACKALNPIWNDFADWSQDLGISVGQVDVTVSPELSGRFMVTALPTIFHIKDGAFRQYRGSREKDEFMTFIEEKKWEGMEEVSSWKNPSSLQMSIVAKLFKLSMVLRSVHSTLTEEHGFPSWMCYILYGIVTIVIGALLGLILVCIIDFLFPPAAPVYDAVAAGKKCDEEDLKDDTKGNEDERQEDSEGKEIEDSEDMELQLSSEGEKSGEGSDKEERAVDADVPTVRKRKPRKAT